MVYIFCCNPYGLIYSGEPTFMLYFGFEPALFANPKSAILVALSFINKLAGLRSRWMNPDSPIWMKPYIKSRIMGIAYYSDSFPLFFNRFYKSP